MLLFRKYSINYLSNSISYDCCLRLYILYYSILLSFTMHCSLVRATNSPFPSSPISSSSSSCCLCVKFHFYTNKQCILSSLSTVSGCWETNVKKNVSNDYLPLHHSLHFLCIKVFLMHALVFLRNLSISIARLNDIVSYTIRILSINVVARKRKKMLPVLNELRNCSVLNRLRHLHFSPLKSICLSLTFSLSHPALPLFVLLYER